MMGEFHKYLGMNEYVGSRRVKIAILDTGVDWGHSGIKTAVDNERMKKNKQSNRRRPSIKQKDDNWCKNWVGPDKDDVYDSDGHGTHVADLIHRTAPGAEIYVARVFKERSFGLSSAKAIAEVCVHFSAFSPRHLITQYRQWWANLSLEGYHLGGRGEARRYYINVAGAFSPHHGSR